MILSRKATIISQFKGPMKKVVTTTGVLMIVFSVVDAKTKEELSCKAFGKGAEALNQGGGCSRNERPA